MTRRKVKVRHWEADTDSGSVVKLGVIEDEGRGVQLTFIPAKGPNCRKGPTRVGLSRAAMLTLVELWRQHLEFEEKKSQLQYRAMLIVRRLIPWAWAGIPPVVDPEAFRRIEGEWHIEQQVTQEVKHE